MTQYDFLGHPLQKTSSMVFSSLDDKIKEALSYGQQYDDLDNALWPFQSFSITVGELLKAAQSHSISFNISLEDKLKEAYRHTHLYNLTQERLWTHHDFALSVNELLETALNKINSNLVSSIKKEVEENKKQYEYVVYAAKMKNHT